VLAYYNSSLDGAGCMYTLACEVGVVVDLSDLGNRLRLS
jgi:hypothetical protein